MIQFQRATTPEEVQKIVRLRYEVYVEEMKVYVSKADHDQRILTDELDDTNRLLYAQYADETCGSISLLLGSDAPFTEEFSKIYDLPRFEKVMPASKMAAAIRLVVTPEHRGSTLPFKLMSESIREWVNAGVQLGFCTCQPHLINLYQRLGFQSYSHEVYNDPQFGIMIPLVLVMGDAAHLAAVRSPIRTYIAEGEYDTTLLPNIYQAIGKTSVEAINPNDSTSDWEALSKMLQEPKHESAKLLEGLNKEEIKQVIALGHIIDCNAGDQVIKQGQVAQTVFVPLSGTLEVRTNQRLVAIVPTGEMLGEMSFLLGGRRTTDVFAGVGGAKVLSLNEKNLRKFIEQPSQIATTLLLNISKSLAIRLAKTTQELGK